MKEDENCSMREVRNAHDIFAKKCEGNSSLWKYSHKWECNKRMGLLEIWHVLYLSVSHYSSLASSSKPLGSIKDRKCLDY